jgi:hypothetical protein
MNPSVKALWLTALRSNEYTQTTGALQRVTPEINPGFCCLGVLCDLYIKHAPNPTVKWSNDDATNLTFHSVPVAYTLDAIEDHSAFDVLEYCTLPSAVQEWSGVDNIHVISNLTLKNDEGQTFTAIADYIDEVL